MASIPSNGYAEVMAGTNNYSGSNSYDGSCPRTAIPPVIGDDLTNKTYVDNATGGGIIGTLTDKGSLITGDGTQAVIFDQNPYQTALTTTTVYDWNSLAIGQSRQFTTTFPTLIPLGAEITITYSGTDSIKGTITAVAGTTITITITNLASAVYTPTTLLTTFPANAFDPLPAGNTTLALTPAITTPNPPDIPANTIITAGVANVNSSVFVGTTNYSITLSGTNVVRGQSNTQPAPISGSSAIQFDGANGGCFFGSTQTPVITVASSLLALLGEVSGLSVPPDFVGSLDGYTLSYGTGSIVIDDDICLIADPLSSTGLAWGVINTASIGAVTSVSGGVNIVMSGTIPAPIVNLRNPLTAELNMGSQSLRDSASAVGTSGQLLSAGTGGQTLWTNPLPTNPTITDTNTNATYYPTFVAGSGTQPLLADISTGPISLNPSNGNFNVVNTMKLTQSQLSVGLNAGLSSQGAAAVAIGLAAGQSGQGGSSIAIGQSAGNDNQGANCIALGQSAGRQTARANCVAIGLSSGEFNQGQAGGASVAIGENAGNFNQGSLAIGIGARAGNSAQGEGAVAVSYQAGENSQGIKAIAVGYTAGRTNQGASAVAIGELAGNANQSTNSVAIGFQAGLTAQGTESVAIGYRAGETQGAQSVAIGNFAGFGGGGVNTIAIGDNAGSNGQNTRSIAIGQFAGQFGQLSDAVAIGDFAAAVSQGSGAIAIGKDAGRGVLAFPTITNKQGANAVAIGLSAGQNTQGVSAVSVGVNAGQTSQGSSAVAIGNNAGQGTTSGQGANAIAIGNNAGVASQTAGSICLNASGSALNPNQAGLFINPIRNLSTISTYNLQYDPTTNEVVSFINEYDRIMEDFVDGTGSVAVFGTNLGFNETGAGSCSYFTGQYHAGIVAGASGRRGVLLMNSGGTAGNSTQLLTDLIFSFANIKKVTFGIIPHTQETLAVAPVPAGNITQQFGISDATSATGVQTADTIIWRMTSSGGTIPAWQFVINNVVQYTLTITPTNMTAKWSRVEINLTYGGGATSTVSSTWYNLTDGTQETTGTYTITAGTGFPASLTTPNTCGIVMGCQTNNATNKYMGVDYVEVQQDLYPVGSGTTETTGR
jgi:hypothetical protein